MISKKFFLVHQESSNKIHGPASYLVNLTGATVGNTEHQTPFRLKVLLSYHKSFRYTIDISSPESLYQCHNYVFIRKSAMGLYPLRRKSRACPNRQYWYSYSNVNCNRIQLLGGAAQHEVALTSTCNNSTKYLSSAF